MTTLTARLEAASKKTATIKNFQLFLNGTIEKVEKNDRELIFFKGYDSDEVLDTVLLNSEPSFNDSAEFAMVLNIRESSKGKAGSQVLKLTKPEYEKYMKIEEGSEEPI